MDMITHHEVEKAVYDNAGTVGESQCYDTALRNFIHSGILGFISGFLIGLGFVLMYGSRLVG